MLGTDTLARPQSLRVMYQMTDANGNSRVNAASNPTVQVASGSIPCSSPDGASGIGECSGSLPPSLFASSGSVPLSLAWGSMSLTNFASVTLQQEPLWSRNGGWNVPAGTVTQAVAFGLALPFEDLYIPAGTTRATLSAQVYLKTHMAEDSAAERQVAVGKFKLVFPPASCTVLGDSNRNAAFATWERVSGGTGEYALLFRNGNVEGHAASMVAINLSCLPGAHQIGVETAS